MTLRHQDVMIPSKGVTVFQTLYIHTHWSPSFWYLTTILSVHIWVLYMVCRPRDWGVPTWTDCLRGISAPQQKGIVHFRPRGKSRHCPGIQWRIGWECSPRNSHTGYTYQANHAYGVLFIVGCILNVGAQQLYIVDCGALELYIVESYIVEGCVIVSKSMESLTRWLAQPLASHFTDSIMHVIYWPTLSSSPILIV